MFSTCAIDALKDFLRTKPHEELIQHAAGVIQDFAKLHSEKDAIQKEYEALKLAHAEQALQLAAFAKNRVDLAGTSTPSPYLPEAESQPASELVPRQSHKLLEATPTSASSSPSESATMPSSNFPTVAGSVLAQVDI